MIRDFVNSIVNIRSYPEFRTRTKRQIAAYAAFLTLIFWIMTALIPLAQTWMRTGGPYQLIEDYVPEFTLSGGKLSVAEKVHLANGSVYVDINTDPENHLDPEDKDVRTRLALNNIVLMADSDCAIYMADMGTGLTGSNARLVRFADLGSFSYDRNTLISEVPKYMASFAGFLVLVYFLRFLGFLIWAAAIASFGRLLAKILGFSLPYGDVFRMSVYSRTIPVLVQAGFILMGFAFAEFAALSLLFSLYILTKAYRYIGAEETGRLRTGETGSRQQREQTFRNPADDDPRTREETSGAAGPNAAPAERKRIPTPKTPDGELPCGTYLRRRYEETGMTAEGSAEAEKTAAQCGEEAPEERNAAESGKDPAERAAEKADPTEKAKPAPDLLLPNRLENRDIRPSSGWSFGTLTGSGDAERPEQTDPAEETAGSGTETSAAEIKETEETEDIQPEEENSGGK